MKNQNQISESQFALTWADMMAVVCGVLSGYGLCKQDQEETTQCVLLKAWQNRHLLTSHPALAGWLVIVSHNEARTLIRKKVLNRKTFANTEKLTIDGEIQVSEAHRNENIDALSHLLAREEQEKVVHCMDQEKPVRREIARLFYFDGRDVNGIGKMLGMNRNTVLSHLRRFRQSMLTQFQQR